VGLAAGAWLGGRRPAVLMQNSGLGASLGALASLSLMYGLPALLLVTWRGFDGADAPEHILTGEITPKLLELLGIPYRVLGRADIDEQLGWARRAIDAREAPVALLVPPGVIEEEGETRAGPARPAWPCEAAGRSTPEASLRGLCEAAGRSTPEASLRESGGGLPEVHGAPHVLTEGEEDLIPVISRHEALAVALKQLGDEPVIHANGYICRESCALVDRPQNFYMLGSMGLASAIGLGLALARPGRPCVVFDGDGNLLMNLGVIATVGSLRPANFLHVVFDNEVDGSTGNQPSPRARCGSTGSRAPRAIGPPAPSRAPTRSAPPCAPGSRAPGPTSSSPRSPERRRTSRASRTRRARSATASGRAGREDHDAGMLHCRRIIPADHAALIASEQEGGARGIRSSRHHRCR
jgi:phosphonopyruvate decarboxylase